MSTVDPNIDKFLKSSQDLSQYKFDRVDHILRQEDVQRHRHKHHAQFFLLDKYQTLSSGNMKNVNVQGLF